MPPPDDSPPLLPLATRLWFAWVCLFRVLFDAVFAARVWALRASTKALPEREAEADQGPAATEALATARSPRPPDKAAADATKGLQLLAMLQRDGRFIDFLEQDVTNFTDQEVGAAARLVHEGCRKVVHRVTSVAPLRAENEGTSIVVQPGFSPAEISLVGNVQGTAPYRGTLRHRGWRVSGLHLPEIVAGHDVSVLAPAEVEL